MFSGNYLFNKTLNDSDTHSDADKLLIEKRNDSKKVKMFNASVVNHEYGKKAETPNRT